jgi:hypothetical protein
LRQARRRPSLAMRELAMRGSASRAAPGQPAGVAVGVAEGVGVGVAVE